MEIYSNTPNFHRNFDINTNEKKKAKFILFLDGKTLTFFIFEAKAPFLLELNFALLDENLPFKMTIQPISLLDKYSVS